MFSSNRERQAFETTLLHGYSARTWVEFARHDKFCLAPSLT
jgi:hypothetical protein